MDWIEVFNTCLEEIKNKYHTYHFYCERDFVWTVQKLIEEYISQNNLPYKILNDYPIEGGERRSKSVDLAVVNINSNDFDVMKGIEKAELVIEFKYEPSKMRKNEICVHKLPVVDWKDVLEDIDRVHRFVRDKKSKSSIAILIDEFGRHTTPNHILSGSDWIYWGNGNTNDLNISILNTEII